ncbi:hypothetical protein FNF29_01423 [Cafeteria roenbergensis]|uniref:Uncharacterized protein n=1 Tax=Cafeteria roenbergensis TaxID=33653 RepID=A0A5A8CSA8_CAFRO|nr:hypothetical protein FNF29_01423 [Cafeteria roenbergensis]|eukprot:KAA0156005.1 hypothetical protein FNF29_01423 [Cafeteria roenbergensis]
MEDEALRAMVDAMRDLAQAAQGARRRCTELAAASGSFADLVGTLSTIDDLEDFREKLPRKYQGEEAMAALLGLRKRVKELSAEGGMSLAQAREHLGAGLPLMQCSQQLDVLCRLGYVVREARNRKDGVRYFAAGPRKRPAGMGGSTRR